MTDPGALAQRTHGTTDPGGVWHPVPRRECLTILLGTYAENDKSIDRRRLHCIRYSSVQPASTMCPRLPVFSDWYLRVEKQSTTPVRAWFIPIK